MSRSEHLKWCKDRAIKLIDAGQIDEGFASFTCDMNKHDETRGHGYLTIFAVQVMSAKMAGSALTAEKLKSEINGFN